MSSVGPSGVTSGVAGYHLWDRRCHLCPSTSAVSPRCLRTPSDLVDISAIRVLTEVIPLHQRILHLARVSKYILTVSPVSSRRTKRHPRPLPPFFDTFICVCTPCCWMLLVCALDANYHSPPERSSTLRGVFHQYLPPPPRNPRQHHSSYPPPPPSGVAAQHATILRCSEGGRTRATVRLPGRGRRSSPDGWGLHAGRLRPPDSGPLQYQPSGPALDSQPARYASETGGRRAVGGGQIGIVLWM